MRQTPPTASAIVRRFIRIRSPSFHLARRQSRSGAVRGPANSRPDDLAAGFAVELTADFVLSLTSRRASGRGHHAIVDAVRAVGRLEPRIATQIVGHALDTRGGAAGR